MVVNINSIVQAPMTRATISISVSERKSRVVVMLISQTLLQNQAIYVAKNEKSAIRSNLTRGWRAPEWELCM